MISSEKVAAQEKRMEALGIREDEIVEKFIHGSGSGGQSIKDLSLYFLTKTGAGTLNFGVGSALAGLGALAANDGKTNVNSALGSGSSTVSVTGTTTLKFGSVSQTLSSLTIGAGGC
jgi:hypothetical protein